VTPIDSALTGVWRLGIDTRAFIYLVGRNPNYLDRVREVFRRIDAEEIWGGSSVVTLTEVLTHPKRTHDQTLEQEYLAILLNSANFQLLDTNPTIAMIAADLRARYSLLTPDAIQIATALEAGCGAFLTNDRRLQRVMELRVLVLDELTL
jgi:predicted nucleic acid-binding protein